MCDRQSAACTHQSLRQTYMQSTNDILVNSTISCIANRWQRTFAVCFPFVKHNPNVARDEKKTSWLYRYQLSSTTVGESRRKTAFSVSLNAGWNKYRSLSRMHARTHTHRCIVQQSGAALKCYWTGCWRSEARSDDRSRMYDNVRSSSRTVCAFGTVRNI